MFRSIRFATFAVAMVACESGKPCFRYAPAAQQAQAQPAPTQTQPAPAPTQLATPNRPPDYVFPFTVVKDGSAQVSGPAKIRQFKQVDEFGGGRTFLEQKVDDDTNCHREGNATKCEHFRDWERLLSQRDLALLTPRSPSSKWAAEDASRCESSEEEDGGIEGECFDPTTEICDGVSPQDLRKVAGTCPRQLHCCPESGTVKAKPEREERAEAEESRPSSRPDPVPAPYSHETEEEPERPLPPRRRSAAYDDPDSVPGQPVTPVQRGRAQ